MRRSCLFLIVMLVVSCSSVQRTAVEKPVSFDTVRNDIILCEAKGVPAVCEEKVRGLLTREWSGAQQGELRYFLARSLAKQAKYERAVTLLKELPDKAYYLRDARKLGAESAFAAGDWDGALDFMLGVYLSLSKEEKIPASRIVFLSYLYRGDTAKAAQWYSKLNEVKQQLVRGELDAFLAKDPETRAAFTAALASFDGASAPVAVSSVPDASVEPAAPAAAQDSGGQAEAVAEALPEMAPPLPETPPPAPMVLLDGSYTPDWRSVCLFLSEDDKWRKVNEVVEVFYDWFFKEYSKAGIVPAVHRFLTGDEAAQVMAKAGEQKCFVGIGPLFSEVAVDEFARLSVTTPLPLIAFTPWFSDTPGFLFNLKYTKEREAADIAAWLASREKKRFAIAYPDDLRGRRLRDLYWQAVEAAGGQVTDALAFGPGDKALLDDVEELLSMPEGYNSALYRFRQENADKYKSSTMMKRALDRIAKVTPMQADFDALFVLGSPEQMAALLPAFVYKNVEFDYQSGWERNRVRENQNTLRTEFNLSWEINTITVAAPSEVKGDASFEKNVSKLLDGMTLAAPSQDIGETNAAWKSFSEIFTAKFQRPPYAIEQTLAEIGALVLSAQEKGVGGTLAAFLGQLKSAEWPSLTLNRPVRFTERNQVEGAGEIFIGVKTKGFQPAKELLKEEEKKEEKKEPAAAEAEKP